MLHGLVGGAKTSWSAKEVSWAAQYVWFCELFPYLQQPNFTGGGCTTGVYWLRLSETRGDAIVLMVHGSKGFKKRILIGRTLHYVVGGKRVSRSVFRLFRHFSNDGLGLSYNLPRWWSFFEPSPEFSSQVRTLKNRLESRNSKCLEHRLKEGLTDVCIPVALELFIPCSDYPSPSPRPDTFVFQDLYKVLGERTPNGTLYSHVVRHVGSSSYARKAYSEKSVFDALENLCTTHGIARQFPLIEFEEEFDGGW